MRLAGRTPAKQSLASLVVVASLALLPPNTGAQGSGGERESQTNLETRDQERPALGIHVGRDPQGRILISEVRPDSPAAQAGLQVGDEIVSIRNTRTHSTDQVVHLVQNAQQGDPFTMQVRRDGQLLTATGTLGSYTTFFGQADTAQGVHRPALGIRVRKNASGRLEITEVEPNSPAQTAEIRAGDEIISAGNMQVHTFDEFVAALEQAKIGNPITLQVRRQGQEVSVRPTVTSYAAMFAPTPPGAATRQAMRPRDQPGPDQGRPTDPHETPQPR